MTMTTTAARFHKSTKPANTSPKLQLQSRSPHKHKLSFFIGIHSRCCCLFFTFLVGHSQLIYSVLYVLYDSLTRQRQLRARWYDCIRLSDGSWLACPPEAKADRKAATISNFHFWALSFYFGYLKSHKKKKDWRKFSFLSPHSRAIHSWRSANTQQRKTEIRRRKSAQEERRKKCDDHKNETQKLQTKQASQVRRAYVYVYESAAPRDFSFHFSISMFELSPPKRKRLASFVVIRERSCAAPLVDDMQMSLTNWSSRYTRSRCWRNGWRKNKS